MKIINKYVDEVSKKEFKTKREARRSELKSIDLENMFSFWKYPPKDKDCRFANGGWCYQRTEQEYNKLLDTIIEAIKKYDKWIWKHYEEQGGLKREYVNGAYILGRFVDDGNSDVRSWVYLTGRICKKCYREWGQPYYAIHCNHKQKARKP